MAHEIVALNAFEDSMIGGHIGLVDQMRVFFLYDLGLAEL